MSAHCSLLSINPTRKLPEWLGASCRVNWWKKYFLLIWMSNTHPLHIIIVEVAAPMLISSLIQPWEIFNPSGGWISAHCWWSINSPSQNEHFRQLNRTAIPEKVTAHYNKHQWLLTLFAAEGAFQHQPLRGHFWGLLCFRADLWLFNISASNRVNQQMNYQKKNYHVMRFEREMW